MQKLEDINETLSYLKDGDLLTTDGKDQFILKNKKIYRYANGTHYGLDLNDFIDLYKKTNFYLYEEAIEIDDQKDEAYYRYYKK